MRREEEAFFEYFYHNITARHLRVAIIVKVGSSNYPRAAKNDFGGVDIKQQRRRVLQPSLLSSEEFVMQSLFHSFHCFKKRVKGLRPKPPKVSISIIFCYKSKFTSKQKTRS